MKNVKVLYVHPVRSEERAGYLIESEEDWKEAVKQSKMHSATKNGVKALLKATGKIFVNPFGGYCGIDGKTIKIVK